MHLPRRGFAEARTQLIIGFGSGISLPAFQDCSGRRYGITILPPTSNTAPGVTLLLHPLRRSSGTPGPRCCWFQITCQVISGRRRRARSAAKYATLQLTSLRLLQTVMHGPHRGCWVVKPRSHGAGVRMGDLAAIISTSVNARFTRDIRGLGCEPLAQAAGQATTLGTADAQ